MKTLKVMVTEMQTVAYPVDLLTAGMRVPWMRKKKLNVSRLMTLTVAVTYRAGAILTG